MSHLNGVVRVAVSGEGIAGLQLEHLLVLARGLGEGALALLKVDDVGVKDLLAAHVRLEQRLCRRRVGAMFGVGAVGTQQLPAAGARPLSRGDGAICGSGGGAVALVRDVVDAGIATDRFGSVRTGGAGGRHGGAGLFLCCLD